MNSVFRLPPYLFNYFFMGIKTQITAIITAIFHQAECVRHFTIAYICKHLKFYKLPAKIISVTRLKRAIDILSP
jgi:hypothetical protein